MKRKDTKKIQEFIKNIEKEVPKNKSVGIFKHRKISHFHSIIISSFDEKLCICETCHEYFYKNETPCKTICNKTTLEPIPDELKD